MIRQRRPVILHEGEAITIETPLGTIAIVAWNPPGYGIAKSDTPAAVTMTTPPGTRAERGRPNVYRLPTSC